MNLILSFRSAAARPVWGAANGGNEAPLHPGAVGCRPGTSMRRHPPLPPRSGGAPVTKADRNEGQCPSTQERWGAATGQEGGRERRAGVRDWGVVSGGPVPNTSSPSPVPAEPHAPSPSHGTTAPSPSPAPHETPTPSAPHRTPAPHGTTAPPTTPPRTASLNRQILSLALPALGALVAEPLFVLIDSAMVGHLGPTSLAGLSLASTVLTTVVGLFVFLAYATTATTARLFGAGRRSAALRAGVDGMWLAGLIGVVAGTLLALAAPWVVAALDADGQVAEAATAYLRASAPGIPGMLVVYAATGTLRGLLDTRTPFVVATAGAVLNVAVNAVLLYGVGMGIAGSGLGTAAAQTVMALALAAPVLGAARRDGVTWGPHRQGLTASLGTGTPLLVRTLCLRAAILATVWAATALGTTALAAHQVVSSLWNFVAFALDALAIAAQALIGTALGRASADQAHQDAGVSTLLRRTTAWGAGAGALLGLLLAVGSPWLPHLFTSDPAVLGACVPPLLIAASALPLAGVVYLLDGVLMGAGDGRYLAWAGLGTLVPYLPLAAAVGTGVLGGAGLLGGTGAPDGSTGLVWLWLSFAWVLMGARALLNGLRAQSTAWRH